MAPPQSPSSQRFLFIDRLRGWAVLVMIETHVLNALLRNEFKHDLFYTILTFINGLVAPTFLFCAGFAFAISSHRKWSEFASFGKPARRYTLRLLFILLVGYSLHVPIYSFSRMSHATDMQTWTSFFLVDILQVIAVTLLLLVLFSFLLKRENLLFWFSLVLAAIVIFITPLINKGEFPSLPIWLRGYVSIKYLSQFTLFPWAGFLLAGYLLGYGYIRNYQTDQSSMMSRVTIAALVAILGSIATAFIPVTVYIGNSFWNSPQFVFLRIGLIVLIGSLLWYWEHAYSGATILWPKRWKSIIMLFGTESLLVYTVHLIIVYGHNFSWSFITMFGPNLSYGYCFLLSGMLAAAMYLLAYSWSSIKTWNINYAKILQYAIIVIISARFILAD